MNRGESDEMKVVAPSPAFVSESAKSSTAATAPCPYGVDGAIATAASTPSTLLQTLLLSGLLLGLVQVAADGRQDLLRVGPERRVAGAACCLLQQFLRTLVIRHPDL